LGNTSEIEQFRGGDIWEGREKERRRGRVHEITFEYENTHPYTVRTYTLSLKRKERRGTREWDMKEKRIFNEGFSTQTICCN
jgi:hypothetical protein